MVEVVRSLTFDRWLRKVEDRRAVTRIRIRIDRVPVENTGDVKSVGRRIFGLRIYYGPGYRVYFLQDGEHLILLVAGGDKMSQSADIKTAQTIAETWRRGQGKTL